jgi:predicted nucleotidyltransferase
VATGPVLPHALIEDFCRRNSIRRLSVFGSALRADFGPESDVDFLVEFEPGHRIGLLGMAALERELSAIIGGPADLRTAEDLSPYFRDEVIRTARLEYAA